VRLLAGRPQLGWQLGREQVHLGFEAEPALAVDDDFLDGPASPAVCQARSRPRRNRIRRAVSSEMPLTSPNCGASRCQPILAPGG